MTNITTLKEGSTDSSYFEINKPIISSLLRQNMNRDHYLNIFFGFDKQFDNSSFFSFLNPIKSSLFKKFAIKFRYF